MKKFICALCPVIFFCMICFAQDSISYVPLRASRGQLDCSGADSSFPCRVRKNYKAEDLQKRLDAGSPVYQEGDELTFLYQGEAESVALYGGLDWPLSKLSNGNIWALTIRLPGLEQALIGVQFFVQKGGDISVAPDEAIVFGGAKGPSLVKPSSLLKGSIRVDSLQSEALTERRHFAVYLPPPGIGPAASVYMADGEFLPLYAHILDTLISQGKLPPMAMVGIYNGKRKADPDPRKGDTRALEYLLGFGYTDAF